MYNKKPEKKHPIVPFVAIFHVPAAMDLYINPIETSLNSCSDLWAKDILINALVTLAGWMTCLAPFHVELIR